MNYCMENSEIYHAPVSRQILLPWLPVVRQWIGLDWTCLVCGWNITPPPYHVPDQSIYLDRPVRSSVSLDCPAYCLHAALAGLPPLSHTRLNILDLVPCWPSLPRRPEPNHDHSALTFRTGILFRIGTTSIT